MKGIKILIDLIHNLYSKNEKAKEISNDMETLQEKIKFEEIMKDDGLKTEEKESSEK
jgi:hypothetical protein